MNTNLTFRKHVDDEGDVWALNGPDGAVTYSPLRGINYHWRTPLYDGDTPVDDLCPYAPGTCYTDGSSDAGRNLHRRWAAAGEDDAVIDAELRRWYHTEDKRAGDPQ